MGVWMLPTLGILARTRDVGFDLMFFFISDIGHRSSDEKEGQPKHHTDEKQDLWKLKGGDMANISCPAPFIDPGLFQGERGCECARFLSLDLFHRLQLSC